MRPRARASTTPSPRKANSVSACTRAARLRRVVRSRGRKRADQALDQRPDQRRGRERSVLLGETPARLGISNERVEFVDQRLPIHGARDVNLGLDRLGNQREGQPPTGKGARRERGDGGGERRKRAGRRLRRAFQRRQFARGKLRRQRGDEIGLGREIAIDRTGGDPGADGDRCDLDRGHSAFGRGLAGGRENCGPAGGKPTDDIFGLAVRHDESASPQTNEA